MLPTKYYLLWCSIKQASVPESFVACGILIYLIIGVGRQSHLCWKRKEELASFRQAAYNLCRTPVLSEKLLWWTLQEPHYTHRIIQVRLQNRLYIYVTTVVWRPGKAHHSETEAGPHNQPLPGLALADHSGRYGQNGLMVVSTKQTVWWMWGRKTEEDWFVCVGQILQAQHLTLAELCTPKHPSTLQKEIKALPERPSILSSSLAEIQPSGEVLADKANCEEEVTEKAKCQQWGLVRKK